MNKRGNVVIIALVMLAMWAVVALILIAQANKVKPTQPPSATQGPYCRPGAH